MCDSNGWSTLSGQWRALRVDESHMLESLLAEVCWTSDVSGVDHVQSTCTTELKDRCHVVLSDDVGLHLEFGRSFFFFTLLECALTVLLQMPTGPRSSLRSSSLSSQSVIVTGPPRL